MEDRAGVAAADTLAQPVGAATIRDTPPPAGVGSPSVPNQPLITPIEALAEEERHRAERMAPVVLVLTIAAMLALPFFEIGRTGKIAVYVALVLGGGSVALQWHLSRDAARFTGWKVPLTWYTTFVSAAVATLYFGIFSAAVMLLVLGIYLLALGRSRALALAAYGTAAAVEGVTGVLILTETIADPGRFHADYLNPYERLTGMLLIQLSLLAALLLGRAARRATHTTLTRLARASRAVAQRDAMVAEVRLDLRRAQRGGAGRLSGQELGSFSLGEVIGRGGMGEVYRATHRDTGEPAAVKVLHAQFLDDADSIGRFLREASTAAALDTPNVARVIEIGDRDAPEPYIAMELLTGHDLASYLLSHPRLHGERMRELATHVARGLDAAADAGIVHRDIKPNNLFYARDSTGIGTWKILDFGIARLVSPGDTLTIGTVLGTPAYMAPEQARGRRVDHRADIYSLAAIAYRAMTGFPPFSADNPHAILLDVVGGSPRRPSALADLAADVDLTLAIGMASDPEERFFRAGELATALAEAMRGELRDMWRRRGERIVSARPWR